MGMRLFHGLTGPLLGLMVLMASSGARAKDDCEPIAIAPDARTTVIAGMILPEQTRCFVLLTERDRNVSLQVLKDANIRASLHSQEKGDADNPAARRAHRIVVEQIKRTVPPQLFRVSVSVTP